jgi:hypothetical protein
MTASPYTAKMTGRLPTSRKVSPEETSKRLTGSTTTSGPPGGVCSTGVGCVTVVHPPGMLQASEPESNVTVAPHESFSSAMMLAFGMASGSKLLGR